MKILDRTKIIDERADFIHDFWLIYKYQFIINTSSNRKWTIGFYRVYGPMFVAVLFVCPTFGLQIVVWTEKEKKIVFTYFLFDLKTTRTVIGVSEVFPCFISIKFQKGLSLVHTRFPLCNNINKLCLFIIFLFYSRFMRLLR